MFTIKDCQGLITHCEKMLKEGAEENKEHYLLTVKTANEQLQKRERAFRTQIGQSTFFVLTILC
jgi:hypothetical protein